MVRCSWPEFTAYPRLIERKKEPRSTKEWGCPLPQYEQQTDTVLRKCVVLEVCLCVQICPYAWQDTIFFATQINLFMWEQKY